MSLFNLLYGILMRTRQLQFDDYREMRVVCQAESVGEIFQRFFRQPATDFPVLRR